MSYWTNKVVLVTGASAGLGRCLAKTFAREGARVVLVARGQQALDDSVAEIRDSGGKATSLTADVTQQQHVDRLVEKTIETHGQLDVLVNSVGRSMRGKIEETTAEEFQELLEVNLIATVRCTLTALPHLTATGGHIVNIGSLASKSVGLFLGAYPASKFAMAAYSAQLRLELEPQGVHVLLVCPGPLARKDNSQRYNSQTQGLPEATRRPGGGVRLRTISSNELARQILLATERRTAELVIPGKARWLFALSQVAPRWADRILRKKFN
jgi:short-subunit dehydrogenase